MIRIASFLRAAASRSDVERESFSIFSKLGSKKELSEVEKIADEIMTLSLRELHDLSIALNDPKIIGALQNDYPVQSMPASRAPFPHPRDVFAGVDADARPGMHSK